VLCLEGGRILYAAITSVNHIECPFYTDLLLAIADIDRICVRFMVGIKVIYFIDMRTALGRVMQFA
jgi:hypothetical protein